MSFPWLTLSHRPARDATSPSEAEQAPELLGPATPGDAARGDPARLTQVRVIDPAGELLCAAPIAQDPIRLFPTGHPPPRWTLTQTQLDPDDVLLAPRDG